SALSADYNGDGNPDIAVTCDRDGTVYFLSGNGAGAFTKTSYPGYLKAQYTAAGDFNKDGKADLVVSREQYQRAAVFMGSGGIYELNLDFVPYNVIAADFTSDTNDDILVLNKW